MGTGTFASFMNKVETRDLTPCLGKAGNLPTDEISHFRKGGFVYVKSLILLTVSLTTVFQRRPQGSCLKRGM